MKNNATVIRFLLSFLYLITTSCYAQRENVTIHLSDPPAGKILPGVPVYDSAHLTYTRGKHKYTIDFGEPHIVAMAKEEKKWGDFQFPVLSRTLDGRLMAKIHMSPDAVSSYGKTNYGYSSSSDEGESWLELGEGVQDEFGSLKEGVRLPNGDRIRINTPPAIDEKELQLPPPVATHKGLKFYRHDQLPENRKGIWLSRLKKEDTLWREERAVLDDPSALRYSLNGALPVVWWGDMKIAKDGSVIAGIYPGYYIDSDNRPITNSSIFFYRSADGGRTWKILSRIVYPGKGAEGATYPGFTEPAFEILKDGRFLCVMRTTDDKNGPLYSAVSSDNGRTWSPPQPITSAGVLPRLLQLENDIIVLASGRPGVQLRFSTDGKNWASPFELVDFDLTDVVDWFSTCGYTDLMPAGHDAFYIIYSDFRSMNKAGQIRKSIKFRRIGIVPLH